MEVHLKNFETRLLDEIEVLPKNNGAKDSIYFI